jgi:Mg2+/Co2+ transporter CorC
MKLLPDQKMKSTLHEFLMLVNETQYSRVPIYCHDIDRIVGVAIAKDTLMYAMSPHLHNTTTVWSYI